MMTRLLLVFAAVVVLQGCDSIPGLMDVHPPEDGNAELTIVNVGSRTMTEVELIPCTTTGEEGVKTRFRVEVKPRESWTRRFAPACQGVHLRFSTGGGWTARVTLSEERPVRLEVR
jgi:hypothetical protein